MKMLALFNHYFNWVIGAFLALTISSIFYFRKQQVYYLNRSKSADYKHYAYSYKVLWLVCILLSALFTILLVLNGCNMQFLTH
jgi:hypothetical protein